MRLAATELGLPALPPARFSVADPWHCQEREKARTAMSDETMAKASFFSHQSRSMGSIFSVRPASIPSGRSDMAWPVWADRLPSSASRALPEGGLRTLGREKEGSAEQPLVSYVTVVRNNTSTLARTIESVRKQTYGNVEHIVLDGASTDGTLELIKRYADRLDYFVSEPDQGLYDAINKAVPLARGQLICVLNSDDWLEPRAAEIAVRRTRAWADDASLLLTAALVRSDGRIHQWQPALVDPGSYFTLANDCHNAIYATRTAYERSGPYDTSYRIAADFKWIMACLESGVRFVYTMKPTVNYSLGGASSDVRLHSIECMRVVSERFDFLDPAEVRGLYHCFFMLAGTFASQQSDRPSNPATFLQALVATHKSRPDFVDAVRFASMTRLQPGA
jgi:glycosyltransferase involved in cell wall biosynthesis